TRAVSEHEARILVVDDVPENVRLLEAVLTAHAYDVVSATNGASALEAVKSEKPDLILLDIVMPDIDGYTVCRRLRADDETAMLPVIMVTSSVGEETKRAIEACADVFIPKPFNPYEALVCARSSPRILLSHQ